MNENIIFDKGLSAKDITQIIVSLEQKSPKILKMIEADKYFAIHNTEIEKKKCVYYDRNEKEHTNPNASNAKIPSTFLRNLVEEKQNYSLGKAFVFSIKKDDKEVDKNDPYYKAWLTFLEDILYKFVFFSAGNAVNHGISWAYPWIDSEGNLKINDMPAQFIYPIWKDKEHTELDRLVYYYIQTKYASQNPTKIEYAEYWSDEEKHVFDVTDGYKEVLNVEGEETPIFNHMIRTDENGNKEGVSWGKVPFIAFKATQDEKTQLEFIKDLIDNYDKVLSKAVDGTEDAFEPLLVFKGISPSIDDLLEARELAKMTKTISLDPDGDAHYIQPTLDIKSDLDVKETLRKAIIYSGYGVDFDDARFNGNPNEMVIKCLFQRIDTYTDGFERHFQDFMDNLKYFFDKWYEWKNGAIDFEHYTIFVKFDRSMLINKSSMIQDVVNLQNTGISRKTLLEYNPIVTDVDMELKRIEEQHEEDKKMEADDMFNFNQPDKNKPPKKEEKK